MNIADVILSVAIPLAYIVVIMFVPLKLYARGTITKYALRKTIHVLGGGVVLFLPFVPNPTMFCLASLVLVAMCLFLRKNTPIKLLNELYEGLVEPEEERIGYLQGPFAYAVAIFLLAIVYSIAPFYNGIIIASIWIMIIGDTMASVIGRKYGRHKVTFPIKMNRTIEGSIAMFVISLVVTRTVFQLISPIYNNIQTIVMTSLIATVCELYSPSKWDDLIIPVATVLAMIVLL
jgi:phytol kinase